MQMDQTKRKHPFSLILMLTPIYIEYLYSVAVYQKISNSVGRIDNFRARKLSFLPNELDIFHIRQHNVRILFILKRLILISFIILTATNMNLAVLGVVMTS